MHGLRRWSQLTSPTGPTLSASWSGAARVLPDGARETLTWRSDGTLASHDSFEGDTTTFTYDVNRRLASRQHADGTLASFTYTATGRLRCGGQPHRADLPRRGRDPRHL